MLRVHRSVVGCVSACGEENAAANGSQPRQATAGPTREAGDGRSDPTGAQKTLLINEQRTKVGSKMEISIDKLHVADFDQAETHQWVFRLQPLYIR